MNLTELSNNFDLYWNNIMSNMAPNLDDYEKSEFLTKAQEDLVIKLYSGDGFENTELNRRYLADLIVSTNITPNLQDIDTSFPGVTVYRMDLNQNLLVLISEQAQILNSECCNDGIKTMVNVVPTTYDELNKVIKNPFKRPNNRKVLRIDKSTKEVYIVTNEKNALQKYYYEYLKKPTPIILINLTGTGLTIEGQVLPQNSILHPSLHRTLIQYAVQLAKISWESNNKN